MNPEDTNTPTQSPRTMAELAAARNWTAGGLSSKQDRYLAGQLPSKGWTPGPEDFQLLAEMFRDRAPVARLRQK
jgi:hypothetical protein